MAIAALSSCSTEESELDTLWQSGKSIYTQISVAVPSTAGTRMSEAVVQKDNQFLGIQDLYLIPFYKTGTGDDDPITSADTRLGARVQLPAVGSDAANSIGSTSLYANNNSKLYANVEVNVGTNAFLVYGMAVPTASGNNAVDGKLVATGLDGNPSDIGFSLQPIRENTDVTGEAQTLADYLNAIYNADTWAAVPVLKGLQEQVETMKAGSAASIKAFAQDLYGALEFAQSVEAVAAVRTAILKGAASIDALDLGDYPTDIPAGAAVVLYDTSAKEFTVVTDKNNLGAMSIAINAFTYPAQLWYRSNSRINTDIESKADEYANTTDNDTWAKVLDTYTTKPGVVDFQTKSVAIRNPLEYAVARFDCTIALPAGVTTLKDFEGNEIAAADLAMTGILVGQQKSVDFLFHPVGTTVQTVYDNQLTTTALSAATPNYTLVLETAADTKVNVAIELQNNSTTDIITKTGEIVAPGCRFYLIGQLDPATVETKPEGWGTAGVFKQDHNTQVTFTLRPDKVSDEVLSSLANAYYVLPDLSATALELSLGVTDWRMVTPTDVELK